MKTADLSDPELIAYSREHLLYELQYFLFTAKELARLDKPSPMASVLIESFGIHLRNLIDFFYSPRVKEDDVIAPDFCPGWNETISSTLKAAKERANKELNHLTLQRKSGLDPSKPWDVVGLFNEVSAVAKTFAGKASATKLSPELPKWLNSFHGKMPGAAVVGAMMVSNTTSTMTTLFHGMARPCLRSTESSRPRDAVPAFAYERPSGTPAPGQTPAVLQLPGRPAGRVVEHVQSCFYDFLCCVTGYHWAVLLIFLQLSQTGNCSPGLSDISDTVTL